MPTGRSFTLMRVSGIRVGVSSSWFVVLFLMLYLFTGSFSDTLQVSSTEAFLVAVVASALFFGSILLHEFGHAFAARHEGIRVAGIELFIFGGVMTMSRDGSSPGAAFRIAAAGPAVTLLIVLLSGAIGATLFGGGSVLDAAVLDAQLGTGAVEQLLSLLFGLNLVLLLFNLIPALPLDGGQMLRALVWKATGNRGRATRATAVLGQGFGGLLIAYGAFRLLAEGDLSGLWSAAIGYMLLQGARDAAAQSRFTDRLGGITVADVMERDPVVMPVDITVEQAWDTFFLRYIGWEWFVVVDAEGRMAGLAYRAAFEQLVHGGQGALPVARAVHAGVEGTGEGEPSTDRVRDDLPLEAVLALPGLRRLGAVVAVDEADRVRGVITLRRVAEAIESRRAQPA